MTPSHSHMAPKAVAWFSEIDRDIREETPPPCQLCRMDVQLPLLAVVEGQTHQGPYAADKVPPLSLSPTPISNWEL
jgi:hypothetical protein